MNARIKTLAAFAVLPLMVAGCTADEPEPPEPTEAEPVLKYYGIPNDPCGVIDLTEAEEALGQLEYNAPFTTVDDPEGMSYFKNDTWCSAWFDDGTDQRARLIISIYVEDELVGEAADQDRDLESGMHWAYVEEDFEERPDELPESIVIPTESDWESSYMAQFPEVRDDGFGWDPEGRSLAIKGLYSESNVWLYASLWRYGSGAEGPPDPEPYAELLTNLVDQLPAKFELREDYEGD